jgi:hypothetical protein
LQRIARAHPKGWIAASGSYGAVLAGLGLPSVNHALLQPELDFFRAVFPEMEPGEFNTVFNRYIHVDPAAVGTPRVLDLNIGDHVLLPMVDFGTPLPVTAVTEPTTAPLEYGGQIETAEWELERNSWKLLLAGWVPFGDVMPGQALEIYVPKELAGLQTSVRAVRNYRPDLTAATVGGDFRMGGFIARLEGQAARKIGPNGQGPVARAGRIEVRSQACSHQSDPGSPVQSRTYRPAAAWER